MPQSSDETAELVKLVSQEQVKLRSAEETIEVVKLVSQERGNECNSGLPRPSQWFRVNESKIARPNKLRTFLSFGKRSSQWWVNLARTSATAAPSLTVRDRRVVEVGLTGTSARANCRKNWRSTGDGKPRLAFAAYSGASLRGSCRS